MGVEKDLPAGKGLIVRFQPFIKHQAGHRSFAEDYSPTLGQPMGGRMRNHPRSARRSPAAQDNGRSTPTAKDPSRRWTATLITAPRRSSARSIRPAANCTGPQPATVLTFVSYPQISPTRPGIRLPV
jgi:hypothetical protein